MCTVICLQWVENNEQRVKNNTQWEKEEEDDEIQALSFMLCHLYKERKKEEIQALSFIDMLRLKMYYLLLLLLLLYYYTVILLYYYIVILLYCVTIKE